MVMHIIDTVFVRDDNNRIIYQHHGYELAYRIPGGMRREKIRIPSYNNNVFIPKSKKKKVS